MEKRNFDENYLVTLEKLSTRWISAKLGIDHEYNMRDVVYLQVSLFECEIEPIYVVCIGAHVLIDGVRQNGDGAIKFPST